MRSPKDGACYQPAGTVGASETGIRLFSGLVTGVCGRGESALAAPHTRRQESTVGSKGYDKQLAGDSYVVPF